MSLKGGRGPFLNIPSIYFGQSYLPIYRVLHTICLCWRHLRGRHWRRITIFYTTYFLILLASQFTSIQNDRVTIFNYRRQRCSVKLCSSGKYYCFQFIIICIHHFIIHVGTVHRLAHSASDLIRLEFLITVFKPRLSKNRFIHTIIISYFYNMFLLYF